MFSLGGKTVEYHNGPEKWTPMSWPGKDSEAGAGFVARGANGMQERAKQEGVWGLFRLLEAGTVTRPSNQSFTVAWQLRTHDVTLKVEFRPARLESPFFGVPGHAGEPQLLQPLRDKGVLVPKQITHSGQSCNL
jgi:type VI secretion system protein ImpL